MCVVVVVVVAVVVVVVVGPSWAHVGLAWPYVGPAWAHVGLRWAYVGQPWTYVGPSWGYVNPSWWLILGTFRAIYVDTGPSPNKFRFCTSARRITDTTLVKPTVFAFRHCPNFGCSKPTKP